VGKLVWRSGGGRGGGGRGERGGGLYAWNVQYRPCIRQSPRNSPLQIQQAYWDSATENLTVDSTKEPDSF
jgi:hypothetical protein